MQGVQPSGVGNGGDDKEVSGDNYAWCSVFVLWCFDQSKIGALAFGATLQAVRGTKMWPEGARVWRTLAEQKGQWVTSGYKPGVVVVFDWDKNGTIDHVGIIESVSADGKTLTTIEGNTSTGSNSNGGEVQRRQRTVGPTVIGAFRPKYAGAAPAAQPPSQTIQSIVDRMAADGVTADKAHWIGVLNGTVKPVPEYVKAIIERYQTLMKR